MKIATAEQTGPDFRMTGEAEPDLIISLTDPVRAERYHRQIIDQLYTVDTVDELEAVWSDKAAILDAMHLNFPDLYEIVVEEYDTLKAGFAASRPRPAEPGNSLGIKF